MHVNAQKEFEVTRGLLLLLVLSILLFAAGACKPRAVPLKHGTFLVVSDVHFNPFDRATPELIAELSGTPPKEWAGKFQTAEFPVLGQDTNYALFKSFLEYAGDSSKVPAPEYILISGDFLAHNFIYQFQNACKQADCPGDYKDFIAKTIEFMAQSFMESFPGVPIFASLGNNDAFCGDYWVQTDSEFLKRMLPVWQNLTGLGESFDNLNFLKGGYYLAPHPTLNGQQIVVLNDIFFSGNYQSDRYYHKCRAGGQEAPGREELEWLSGVLGRGQGKSWFVYHIPPGMDAFAGRPMMNLTLESAFLQLMRRHADDILITFAGHTHFDDFRVLNANDRPYGLVHITPSITIDHKNYSAFQSFAYDRDTGAILNFTSYNRPAGDSSAWGREYDYNSTYERNGYNTQGQWQVAGEILKFKGADFEAYERYLSSDSPGVPGLAAARKYACATIHLSSSDFQQCVAAGVRASKNTAP